MEGVKILLVLCLILKCCNCWVNQYDGPLSYECLPGQVLTKISSQHNNYYQDRQWDFQCANTGVLAPSGSCHWTNQVNRYDRGMDFKCPGTGAITGIRGTNNNYYEDRQYDVKCCDVQTPATSNLCTMSQFVNRYDQAFAYDIPSHKYLTGIYSENNDYYEDRRFKFYLCDRPE